MEGAAYSFPFEAAAMHSYFHWPSISSLGQACARMARRHVLQWGRHVLQWHDGDLKETEIADAGEYNGAGRMLAGFSRFPYTLSKWLPVQGAVLRESSQ